MLLRVEVEMTRKSALALRSLTLVRMYVDIARTELQSPSAKKVWVGVSWRARSVAHPARGLWGRINWGMGEPAGRACAKMICNHCWYSVRLSLNVSSMGNRGELVG